MPNYGVRELTWENGQLTVQDLHGLVPSTGPAKPIWTNGLSGCDALESGVHQAPLQSLDCQNSSLSSYKPSVSGGGKRMHSDQDFCFLAQDESPVIGRTVSASTNAAFDKNNDTGTMSWASYESCRSLKTARTGDRDYACAGSVTQETEGDEHETKGETGRSFSRRGRAAAIHNESERRRRDRINQRMKTLQKLVPNASKTDKISILDDVIEYLKQLQAQLQMMMSMRANLPQQMMVPPHAPPLSSVLSMQQQRQQQQQLQMSLLAAMERMGMASGSAFGGFVVPSPPLMVPHMAAPQPQTNKDSKFSSSAALSDLYTAFLAQQTMSMDLCNKMAAAMYKQQPNQTTQVTSNTHLHCSDHGKGD